MRKRNSISSLQNNELPPGTRWIDQYDIIARFHISKDTLDEWHKLGLPRYQLGKKIYYKESELDEILEKHRKPKLNK